MQISWNWLSEYVDLSGVGGPEKLAELLTSRGLEVEEVRQLAKGFDKVITAQILERNPHPQADRLSLCKVAIGQGEPLDIVCGAQNMKAGDKVVLAQIGAHLPNDLKIAQSKIRGVSSSGMLCSEEELCLAEQSEGILILPPETPLGKPFASVIGRDDTVLAFKLTANRGDCLSHFGMAREIAAALGQKVRAPKTAEISGGNCPVSIQLNAGEAAPQFFGVYIEGVKVGPSPDWVVRRLQAIGSRSINNIVDATNLVLFELGHPVHAYDADLIQGGKIGVRMARDGEELPLLDGQTVKLDGSELVIEDGARAVGLAGVMGGGNSEVGEGTTRVFLECAEFAPAMVRRAAAKFVRRTEAAQRFEKGVDPMGLQFAVSRLAQLVLELAGGRVVGSQKVLHPSRDLSQRRIFVPEGYFSNFLGMDISDVQAEVVLRGLDCKVEGRTVVPPSYRLDLSIKEDLAEEVARSVGYDKIPATIPVLTSAPSAKTVLLDRAKNAFAQAGLQETINFAFTSASWLKQLGMESATRVLNPLSEEHEMLVPSLLPGLVRNALDNWRHHFGSESLAIRLFELRPTFHAKEKIEAKGDGKVQTETGVEEKWKLGMALAGPRFASGLRQDLVEIDFSDVKAVVELFFEQMGTRGVRFLPLSASRNQDHPVAKLLHPGQAVEVLAGNISAGFFGMMHPAKTKELKAKGTLWLGELDWDAVVKLSRGAGETRKFKSWPSFPPMERDFAIVVKNEVTADKITQIATKIGKPLAKVVKVFDIYRGGSIAEGMTSVAVRVIFYDEGRSLQESETEAVSARIVEAWKKELGAELRS